MSQLSTSVSVSINKGLFVLILLTLPGCSRSEPVLRLVETNLKPYTSVSGVQFSPVDPSILATSGTVPSDGRGGINAALSVHSFPERKLLQSESLFGQIQAIAFSPNGETLAIADGSYTAFASLRLYDVKQKKLAPPIITRSSWIHAVAYSPDGRSLITCSSDSTDFGYGSGEVAIWDTSNWTRRTLHKDPVLTYRSVAFSSDGSRFVVGGGHCTTHSEDGEVSVWDAATNQRIWFKKAHFYVVESVSFSPDGSTFVSGGMDGLLMVWDAKNGERLSQVDYSLGSGRVLSTDFSSDGRYLAVGLGSYNRGGKWGQVRLLKCPVATDRGDLLVETEQPVSCLKFSPDGRLLAAGDADGNVRVWELPR